MEETTTNQNIMEETTTNQAQSQDLEITALVAGKTPEELLALILDESGKAKDARLTYLAKRKEQDLINQQIQGKRTALREAAGSATLPEAQQANKAAKQTLKDELMALKKDKTALRRQYKKSSRAANKRLHAILDKIRG